MLCVQRLSRKPASKLGQGCANLFRLVNRIADQSMTDRGQVDANLMGAPCFQTACQQRPVCAVFDHGVMRRCRLAIGRNRHALAIPGVASNRCFDRAVVINDTVDNGGIGPADRSRLHLAYQVSVRSQRFRHHQQTAGVLVEPVNDTGSR